MFHRLSGRLSSENASSRCQTFLLPVITLGAFTLSEVEG